jgi:hypothetical protein
MALMELTSHTVISGLKIFYLSLVMRKRRRKEVLARFSRSRFILITTLSRR